MITIPLSSQEAKAHRLAGDAQDSDVESVIYLMLTVRGVNESDANAAARSFANAALNARRKIREATAYEIVVQDEVQDEVPATQSSQKEVL